MSINKRLWSKKVSQLTPYVAGEQPKVSNLCKLNTNENPFPPSQKAVAAMQAVLADNGQALRLYPEPESDELCQVLAHYHGLQREQVFVGNGSDEVLAFVFACFFTKELPLLMPDVSYSFYPVYAQTFGVDTKIIPLDDEFCINPKDYDTACSGIILPNPNAPTGILLSLDDIRTLATNHPDSVIVIDEAYIDYADDVKSASAIGLIDEFDNILVTQTFSKSRALAGLRVGAAFGNANLIAALATYQNSFNSYPIDRVAQAGAMASILDEDYFIKQRQAVIRLRNDLTESLVALGFKVLPSAANFVFAKPNHTSLSTKEIFNQLREQGVIMRHWDKQRIADYLRITVGTAEQNQRLITALTEILS
ncbi:histidinol-phosphate transaminase [Moraxella sp. ZY200743]|uniref:histidinol-phosphate transaminase n=1 Tax=Moraxella sp. ZY200743 TaxID=2911970 RepID=UPI003D7DE771